MKELKLVESVAPHILDIFNKNVSNNFKFQSTQLSPLNDSVKIYLGFEIEIPRIELLRNGQDAIRDAVVNAKNTFYDTTLFNEKP